MLLRQNLQDLRRVQGLGHDMGEKVSAAELNRSLTIRSEECHHLKAAFARGKQALGKQVNSDLVWVVDQDERCR